MIAVEIDNVKSIMSKLFATDKFDLFHVREIQVVTFTTFIIDGSRQALWNENVKDENLLWSEIKECVYQLIKGDKPPLKLKIDFCHQMNNGDIGSLRIQYEKEKLSVFSGYMQKSFSLDKNGINAWDEKCAKFLEEFC